MEKKFIEKILDDDILKPTELMKYMIIGILLALAIASTTQPFVVVGNSMYPTLKNGDKTIVNKINKNYKNGDIVVFKHEDNILIKRIVAREGDIIDIQEGQLYINSAIIKDTSIEDYAMIRYKGNIPKGFVYVLGDNRKNSTDSRFYGLINIKTIIGKTINIH